MKNKLKVLLTVFVILVSLFVITSCDNADSDSDSTTTTQTQEHEYNSQIYAVYEAYVAYSKKYDEKPVSYEEWLRSVRGEKGEQGLQGIPGNGIRKIEKISSSNGTDTYRITFTDSTHFDFSVQNGKDGLNGKNIELRIDEDTNYIQWKYTTDSTWTNLISVDALKAKDGSDGLNGKDGLTPYIGENGNWWIGEFDTGIVVDLSKADSRELTIESNGLVYSTMTLGGRSGYVVSGWVDDYFDSGYVNKGFDLSKLNIVIPNYIGNVPVIGVLNSAFKGNTKLKSISLSKNTVYLDSDCFENCSNLETIDFNDCKLPLIPSYCFSGTKITRVKLPETVTALHSHAFYNCTITDINYENIVRFDDYCLNNLAIDYLYLSKNVESIGNNAFAANYIYTEHPTIPATWSESLMPEISEMGICTNAKISGKYIYTINNTGITLNRYLGNDKKLIIPSQIEGQNVTAIGYGFCSISVSEMKSASRSGATYSDFLALKRFDEIVIPDTVTKIEAYALMTYDTMIYIPDSVTSMWYLVGCVEYNSYWDNNSSSYLAFESNKLPDTVFETYNLEERNITEDYIEAVSENGGFVRYSLNADYSKMVYDETSKTWYYDNDGVSYSLMAIMGGCGKRLVLTAVYNDKPVNTIMPFAVSRLDEVQAILIPGAYSRIRTNAFSNLTNCSIIWICKDVEVINANAFCQCGNNFLIESSSKPLDWDSAWNGNKNFEVDVKSVNYNDEYIYSVADNNKAILIAFLGTVDGYCLEVPRYVDGYEVYGISSYCYKINEITYTSGYYYNIYIPASVCMIGKYAFNYDDNNVTIYIFTEMTESEYDTRSNGGELNWNTYLFGSSRYSYTFRKSNVNFGNIICNGCRYTVNDDNTLSLKSYARPNNSGTVIIQGEVYGYTVKDIDSRFIRMLVSGNGNYIIINTTDLALPESLIYSSYSYQCTITIYTNATSETPLSDSYCTYVWYLNGEWEIVNGEPKPITDINKGE